MKILNTKFYFLFRKGSFFLFQLHYSQKFTHAFFKAEAV